MPGVTKHIYDHDICDIIYNGPLVKTTSRKFIVNTTTYFVS